MANPAKAADTSKTDPQRPPPFPASYSPAKSTALARLGAFLEIRRLRLAAWVRGHKALAGLSAAILVLAGAAGALVALDAVPEVDLFAPDTMAEARDRAVANPTDAEARRELGHKLWAAKMRRGAVSSYARALALDPASADERMVRNLVACFGGKRQPDAEALIVKYQLVAAAEPLEKLVSSRRHSVRWAAVRTLDRLGKGTKASWESAYIQDLDSPDCDVRRTAVDKLGAIGTRRAISALRSARDDDAKTGGFFRSRCLGDRLDTAEERILARR